MVIPSTQNIVVIYGYTDIRLKQTRLKINTI